MITDRTYNSDVPFVCDLRVIPVTETRYYLELPQGDANIKMKG